MTDDVIPGQLWEWDFTLAYTTDHVNDGSWYLEPVSEARRQFYVSVEDSGGMRLIKNGDTFLIVSIDDEGPYEDASIVHIGNKWYIALLHNCLVWINKASLECAKLVRNAS